MHRIERSHEAGFTMIELVVVMVLIGIITALAVPRFVFPKAGAAAGRLVSDIRYAKELAIRFQNTGANPCCGLFIINATSYRIFTSDSTGTAVTDPHTGTPMERTMTGKFSGITVTYPTSFSGNILKFNSLGTPYEGSGAGTALGSAKSITVNGPGGPRTVTIEPNTGKVTGS